MSTPKTQAIAERSDCILGENLAINFAPSIERIQVGHFAPEAKPRLAGRGNRVVEEIEKVAEEFGL